MTFVDEILYGETRPKLNAVALDEFQHFGNRPALGFTGCRRLRGFDMFFACQGLQGMLQDVLNRLMAVSANSLKQRGSMFCKFDVHKKSSFPETLFSTIIAQSKQGQN
jgi:hypothetical protein